MDTRLNPFKRGNIANTAFAFAIIIFVLFGWQTYQSMRSMEFADKAADLTTPMRYLISSGIIGIILFFLAFILLKRNNSRLQESDNALRLYQGQLNDLVNTRTAQLKEEIAEHVAALASLSSSEERYRGLFNSLLEGYCMIEMIFDADGKPVDYLFLEINPAFENQTGLHGVQGKLMSEISPENEKYWNEIYGKVAATGVPVQFENEAKALNRHFDVSAFRVGGEESRKVAICFNDITHRKHAGEELINSERRYSALFANKINGMVHCRIITNEQGKPVDYIILQINEAYERIIGVKKADVEGRSVLEVFPDIQSYAIDYIGMYGRIALDNGEISFEEFFEATGQYLSIYAYCPVPGEFIAIFTDVTDRKQAQEISAFQARLLSEVNDAVFSSDQNFRINYWNKSAEKIFGWTKEEALGNISGELLKPMTEGSTLDEVRSKLRNEGYWQGEGQYLRKDGTYFFVEVNSKTIKDPEGKYIGQLVVARDITESKRAQEELKESEEKFRLLANTIPQLAWIANADGYIFWYNRGWYDYTGTTPEEMEGWGWQSVHDPELLPNVMEKWKASLATEKPFEMVFPLLGKDGKYRSFLTRSLPLFNDKGELRQWFGTNTDISVLQEAEKAVHDSEERFRVMANTMPQLAWIANADGYIFWYNQGWYDYTGTTPEQMEGWGWQSVHDPELLPNVMEKWKASLETEKPFEMVFPLLGKDGKYRSFLTRSLPLFNDKGELMQWFGTNTDISAIQKAETDLKEAKDKLNLVLDNGHIGIWERDLKAGTLLFDKRMEKMFGIEEGKFEGTFEAFQNHLVEEDIPHVKEAIRKAVEEDVPIDTIYRVVLPDGNINHINSKGFVIQKEDGKAIKIAGVCFDITNLQEDAEHSLFKLNEELLRSNKELEQFAYVASHDLQEPLRTVSTFTQLLASRYRGKLDDDANQFIHYTVEAASRMQVLINDLMTYSRVGTKNQILTTIDFNNIVRNAILNLEASIKEKNAEVTYDDLPSVVADEGQLVQLMQNLIGNAIKYCKETPKVHISAKEEPEHYLFSVKDNGIGIEHQYAEKIFLIFQRLVAKHEFTGSGIGLAVCKRIVEGHNGKISFESELGVGTTFFFTIPKTKETRQQTKITVKHKENKI